MTPFAYAQLPIIARRILAELDSGREVDPHRIAWARDVLAFHEAGDQAACRRVSAPEPGDAMRLPEPLAWDELIEQLEARYGISLLGSESRLQHFARDWRFLTTPDPEAVTADQLREAVEQALADERSRMIADGWRQCAQGQRTTQWCGAAEAAIAAEREACAKVCDAIENGAYHDGHRAAGVAWECADSIRARK